MIVFTITSHAYHIIWKQCIQSQQAYCDRCGYTYYHIHLPTTLTPDSVAWSKLHFLRSFLTPLAPTGQGGNNGPEVVMYIDADCEIKETCPRIETLMQSGKELFVAPGFSGRINSGVIVAHQSPEALSLISTVIDNRKTILPDSDKVGRVYGGGENGHIIHYRKNSPIVQLIDQRRNNNHTPDLDDYIRHYSAGGSMRSLYKMDMISTLAWYGLILSTYLHKIFRKLGLIDAYDKVSQPDLDDIVKKHLLSICV